MSFVPFIPSNPSAGNAPTFGTYTPSLLYSNGSPWTTAPTVVAPFIPFVPFVPQYSPPVPFSVRSDAATSVARSETVPSDAAVPHDDAFSDVSNLSDADSHSSDVSDDADHDSEEDVPPLDLSSPLTAGGKYFIQDSSGNKSTIRLSSRDIKHIKNVAFRDRYLLEHFGLSWDSPDPADHIKLMCFYGVDPNTFSSYSSHWNSLRKNGFDITVKDLMKYLTAKRKTYSNNSLTHWKSAVKLHQAAMGLLPDEEQFKYFCNGYAHDNPDGLAKKRGAITASRLRQLVNHRSVKGTLYETAYQVQYAVGLRSDQMSAMHISHFQLVFDPKIKTKLVGYVYVCPKHKFKSAHLRSATEHHICDEHYLPLLTAEIESARLYRGGFLCPNWNPTHALEKIKSAAPDLEWDANLQWVNHGIRHGACVDAADNAADQTLSGRLIAAQHRCQQGSFSVLGEYCQSNEARSALAQAAQLCPQGLSRVTVNELTCVKRKGSYVLSHTPVEATAGRGKKGKFISTAAKLQALNAKAKSALGELTSEAAAKLVQQAAARLAKEQKAAARAAATPAAN